MWPLSPAVRNFATNGPHTTVDGGFILGLCWRRSERRRTAAEPMRRWDEASRAEPSREQNRGVLKWLIVVVSPCVSL